MALSFSEYISGSIEALSAAKVAEATVAAIVRDLKRVIAQGGTIYACGNGGSACDSMHFVEELVARYEKTRPGIRAQHLLDPGTLTCWANDVDFISVFRRQVETFVTNKDALIVLTTSGNSKNILEALKAGMERGACCIAFLGKNGGAARGLATHDLLITSQKTSFIQQAHMTVLHYICEQLEAD